MADWVTKVEQGLPDGKFCVHVLKDGVLHGFAMKGKERLEPVFDSEDEAERVAKAALKVLNAGETGDDTLTIAALR